MGIPVMSSFDLMSKDPLDSRDVFETIADMKAFPEYAINEYHKSLCLEDNKMYIWKSTNDPDPTTARWREDKGAEGELPPFSRTDPTTVDVGGLKAGTVIDGKDPNEIIEMMAFPYQPPAMSISISPATTLYETGTQANITVSATTTKKSKDIQEATIDKNGASVETDTTAGGTTFTYADTAVTTDTTYSGVATDGTEQVNANSISVKFTRKSFYGPVDDAPTDDTGIEALDNNVLQLGKGLSWNGITVQNKKLCYAYEASKGDLTGIVDGNGFTMFNAFTKTTVQRDGVDYNVYTLNKPMGVTNGTLIFS